MYIEVWVCNQLDHQTNLGYIDLFHLLLLKFFFKLLPILGSKLFLVQNP